MTAMHPALADLRPAAGPVLIGAFAPGPFADVAAWQFPAGPLSVPQARALCRQTVLAWGAAVAAARDAESIVCELITNSVRHGRPPICVQLGRAVGELVTAVYDGSDTMPVPREPREWDAAGEVTGRGLSMVIPALASSWAITPCQRGKIVTAWLAVELDAAGSRSSAHDGPPLSAIVHGTGPGFGRLPGDRP